MDDESPGVPEWVVTYGDMMSLLLTFFIMLVSLSEVVANERYRAVLEAIHQYVGYSGSPTAPPGTNFPLNSFLQRLKSLGSHTNEDVGRGGVKKRSVEGTDVRVFRTREGEALHVGDVIFPPGQAALDGPARTRLSQLLETLAGKPNKLEIRGYAPQPATPAGAAGYAEALSLSYARCRGVVDFLSSHDVDGDRLRIVAGPDTGAPPKAAAEDAPPPNPHRVELWMLDVHTEELVGPYVTP